MVHVLLAVIYLAFISLGLPDSLLGAAWPLMYPQMGVSVSYAGIVSMIICCGTVTSSLLSDRLTRKFGTGVITAVSVAMTALALLGFSVSTKFWMLCVIAVPYGLGAGSIDSALNNYVALHYSSKHMSWLHCMWGVGASIGPYIMGYCLSSPMSWPGGYQIIGLIQIVLAVSMALSLPLWKKTNTNKDASRSAPLSLGEIFRIPGAKADIFGFFAYCAAESTIFLWASSYMVLHRGIPEETAAAYAGVFYLGMTVGRGLNGFLTIRFRDSALIRMGSWGMVAGIIALMIPGGDLLTVIALGLLGLGCAPIYPSVIHSTPKIFGADRSQALIGVQMAAAYSAALIMPPIFGLIANYGSITCFPVYLLVITGVMILCHQILFRIKH